MRHPILSDPILDSQSEVVIAVTCNAETDLNAECAVFISQREVHFGHGVAQTLRVVRWKSCGLRLRIYPVSVLSELANYVQNAVPKISAEMNGRGIAEVLTQFLTEK